MIVFTEAIEVEIIRAIGLSIPGFTAAWVAWLAWKQGKRIIIQGQELRNQVDENHKQVDGRMEQLLELKGKEGQQIGKDKEKARAETAQKAADVVIAIHESYKSQ